jgi:lysophospholipase L1-like esterase
MRYVAIGDSFTEGVGDQRPDGSLAGWADRVAKGLAAARGETVQYANLAIRGRLLEPIVTEQLDAALSMSPPATLISLNGGGNDMMRPGADVRRLIRLTERAVERCCEAGVSLLLLSGPDPSDRLPFGGLMRRRGVKLTTAVADLAARRGLVFVDLYNDEEVRDPVYWSPDRLHLNAAGHQRVATAVLAALGYDVPAHQVTMPRTEGSRTGEHSIETSPAETVSVKAVPAERPRPMAEEVRYYREHVLPWVRRRLRGQSSGDGRTAKHPTWSTVAQSASRSDSSRP